MSFTKLYHYIKNLTVRRQYAGLTYGRLVRIFTFTFTFLLTVNLNFNLFKLTLQVEPRHTYVKWFNYEVGRRPNL
jgi:hypothetical protein